LTVHSIGSLAHSLSLRPKAYVTACQSVPFIPSDRRSRRRSLILGSLGLGELIELFTYRFHWEWDALTAAYLVVIRLSFH